MRLSCRFTSSKLPSVLPASNTSSMLMYVPLTLGYNKGLLSCSTYKTIRTYSTRPCIVHLWLDQPLFWSLVLLQRSFQMAFQEPFTETSVTDFSASHFTSSSYFRRSPLSLRTVLCAVLEIRNTADELIFQCSSPPVAFVIIFHYSFPIYCIYCPHERRGLWSGFGSTSPPSGIFFRYTELPFSISYNTVPYSFFR